jgi:hypothetical protein
VKVGLVGYFADPGWLKTQKRLTAWFVGVPAVHPRSPRNLRDQNQKECDSRVPERDVKHANHRNAPSREVTVRSGAGRSRGCVQCSVRLRDRESNLLTREGWCKRQEGCSARHLCAHWSRSRCDLAVARRIQWLVGDQRHLVGPAGPWSPRGTLVGIGPRPVGQAAP